MRTVFPLPGETEAVKVVLQYRAPPSYPPSHLLRILLCLPCTPTPCASSDPGLQHPTHCSSLASSPSLVAREALQKYKRERFLFGYLQSLPGSLTLNIKTESFSASYKVPQCLTPPASQPHSELLLWTQCLPGAL